MFCGMKHETLTNKQLWQIILFLILRSSSVWACLNVMWPQFRFFFFFCLVYMKVYWERTPFLGKILILPLLWLLAFLVYHYSILSADGWWFSYACTRREHVPQHNQIRVEIILNFYLRSKNTGWVSDNAVSS